MKDSKAMWLFTVAVLDMVMLGSLTGCLTVGYSGSSGWFIWPGGIGLVLMILLVLLVLRRR